MMRVVVLAALLAAAAAGAGCAKAQARAEPEIPALAVPEPPPRIVSPLESEPLPVAAEVAPEGEPEPPNPPRSRPARSGQRTAEAPKEEAGPPAGPVEARRPAAGDEAPRLRMVQPSEALPLERSIQQVLTRAAADLNRVDYGALGADARGQYDTAKRFIQQGEDALKVKNYVFAEILADKAAVLAGVLLGR